MRARAEKARRRRFSARLHGVLHLVSVAVLHRRARDREVGERHAAEARERVQHALFFQPQLLVVVHVAEIAAAAAVKIRAVRLGAVRRGCNDL